MAALEHGGPCNENICARCGQGRRGFGRDAAIHLKVDVASIDHRLDAPNLLDLRWNESLAAEARVDAHYEDEVDPVEDIFDDAFGRAWIERNARFRTEPADYLKRPVEMRACFGMDRYDVGPCLCERLEIRVDRGDLEMHVEDFLRPGADALDEARAERDVRHEVAVHHIDMHPVAASIVDRTHFLAEAGKVGGKDGGGDQNGPAHS